MIHSVQIFLDLPPYHEVSEEIPSEMLDHVAASWTDDLISTIKADIATMATQATAMRDFLASDSV